MTGFYEEHGIPLQRMLTDRGTEYCGTHDRHEYELYLAIEDIDHTRTKTKSPHDRQVLSCWLRANVFLRTGDRVAKSRA